MGAEVIKVIRTDMECRGNGTPDNPYRRIVQFWSLDGVLLMEEDPLDNAAPLPTTTDESEAL